MPGLSRGVLWPRASGKSYVSSIWGIEHMADFSLLNAMFPIETSNKKACNTIKKSKQYLDSEETRLRNLHPSLGPSNLFEDRVGNFRETIEMRVCRQARMAYVNALLKINNLLAVQTALDNARDVLRLSRKDEMGVCYMIVGLFLRLGRDQDCYDFIKWWEAKAPNFDWDDASLPYLDMKGEDAFEHYGGLNDLDGIRDTCVIPFTVAIVLIKIRLLFNLRDLQKVSIIRGKLPQELLDQVRDKCLCDAITRNPRRKEISEGKGLTRLIRDLKSSIHDFVTGVGEVNEDNPSFWAAMLNKAGFQLNAEECSVDISQMAPVHQYSYESWSETPGALEVIHMDKEDPSAFLDVER
ncbi:uncharacterized protein PAC_09263 [Phialocephala subalpina]|uniref:Uncharacterized protein n=1 Tax=Phialocephala subalpina TaxID=576137 RepID=A0A1L7X2X7_9HELO|nr:uncharacterized protein PAC_09263 [Phialocephala subalpina]